MIPPLVAREDILFRRWAAKSAPRAIFLLIHGLGAHSGRWEFLGDYFSQNGITSYALELKGFGQSGVPLGHVDSFSAYDTDIAHLKDMIVSEYPGRKVFLIGESMGGLIAYLVARRYPRIADGLIAVSPAFASRLSFSLGDYIAIFASFYLNPRRQFRLPFDSAMCTRDPNYRELMEASHDETRMVSARMLGSVAFAQISVAALNRKISIPTLFLLAGDDSIVDPEASERVFTRIDTRDKLLIRYPDMYHALTIDLNRDRVFADILKWVTARL